MNQPKDYIVQSFDELLKEEYESLSLINKILYHMQNHMIKVILINFVIGYTIGVILGKFW